MVYRTCINNNKTRKKEMRNNALWNCKNPFQGSMEKVLCVCSAGLLRSPTIAYILSNHGFNTRAVGIHDYALIQIDEVLIEWADKIICAEQSILEFLKKKYNIDYAISLDIPDMFKFRDPVLVTIIEEKLKEMDII